MRAIIVDDEQNIRKVLKTLLSENDFETHEAENIIAAKRLIEKNYFFDLAFLDLRLPDGSGLDLLKDLKAASPDTVVLVITAFASTETAVEAMKAGAYDYVIKPFNIEEIRIIIKNIKDKLFLQQRVRELQQYEESFEGIVGQSEAIRTVFGMIEKIAPFDTNVLITGESGTGKELVAKAIHKKSNRANKPFIAINCASLPSELLESELFGYAKGSFTGAYASKRGLIDEASGGTLFLDEIGEMPSGLQAKLLRFLEDKKIRPIGSNSEIEVNVRVISATNKNIPDILQKGEFREDLFYRLATFEIKVPHLRERKNDIPLLIEHFVKVLSKKLQKEITVVDKELVDYAMQQDIKGNVRELKNMIEREIILSENGHLKCASCRPAANHHQAVSDIPEGGMDLNEYLSGIERELLNKALQKTKGIKTKAAELLGLSFREFRYRLSKRSSTSK
jgi:two-component system response regulator PilR (NtrC family)